MGVKKIGGAKAPAPRATRGAGGVARAAASEAVVNGGDEREPVKVGNIRLPRRRKAALTELSDFSALLYAPPKFGKTTFFSTFPDILFLTTEPGTKGLEIFEFNAENGGVTDWTIFMQAVKMLEKSKRFSNVVVDTADEAYGMCMDRVCVIAGVSHPHDADDYGKTWGKVSRAFTTALNRIVQTGRGLYLTSHVKERTIKPASGAKFTRIGPSLTGQAEKAILAFVDLIWYGEVVRDRRRLVLTEGDELVMAGSRKRGTAAPMPPAILLPVDEAEDYEYFAAAFRGEVDGAEAADIWASMTASDAVKKAMNDARSRLSLTEGGAEQA